MCIDADIDLCCTGVLRCRVMFEGCSEGLAVKFHLLCSFLRICDPTTTDSFLYVLLLTLGVFKVN